MPLLKTQTLMSRRKLSTLVFQGCTALGFIGAMGSGFGAPQTKPSSHGTMTGHCLESMQHCLELGEHALKSGIVSSTDLNQALQHLTAQDQSTLQQLIQQDYADMNIATVKGWVLAKTEANLFAALAHARGIDRAVT